MKKARLTCIINPISGTQDKERILKLVNQHLDRSKFEWSILRTEYAGHAPQLVRQAIAEGTDIVVAIGGDGTVNEIAKELVNTDVAFGIIPCGSGNGLARHLEIPMDAMGAIRILNRYETENLDYGIINDYPFFCTCGVGFDAFISSKFAQAGKRGVLTYLENALVEGIKYKPDTYEIEIEGETKKYKAFLITCANASQYGNNAYIAPEASMSDGMMDVTIMEPFNVLEAPQIAIQLFNKTLNKNNKIKHFRCKHIRIHRSRKGVIHYDGDPQETGCDIDVRLVEKGIKVIVNKEKVSSESITKRLSDIYETFITLSMEIHERNKQRIGTLNKQLDKKIQNITKIVNKNLP